MPRMKANEAAFKAELDELFERLTSARRPWPLRRFRQELERAYCEYMIRRSAGDRQRAASRLNIGFSTLKEKIRKTKP